MKLISLKFAYPFNVRSDETSVIDVVAKYYDIARTARIAPEPPMYLHVMALKKNQVKLIVERILMVMNPISSI